MGSRDPTRLLAALTAAQAGWAGGGGGNGAAAVRRLVRAAPDEAEALMVGLAACVAVGVGVGVGPLRVRWPPWVACRLEPTGWTLRRGPRGAGEPKGAPTPEHMAAMAVFTPLCRELEQFLRERQGKGDGPAQEVMAALGVMAVLCGICLAPSRTAARRLVRESLRNGRRFPKEAIGCALEAYCYASQESEESAEHGTSVEECWLELWNEVENFDANSSSGVKHLGQLPLYLWMGSATEETLWAQHVGWHLHCLMATHRMQEVMAELVRYHAEGMLSRLRLDTVKELLMTLPREALDSEGGHMSIGSALTKRLIDHTRTSRDTQHCRLSASSPFSSVGSRLASHVPIVTTDVVLFARMIDYVLSVISVAGSRLEHEAQMSDLQTLFTLANTDSLAASLVPTGVPIECVMEATTDPHRARRMGVLGHSIRHAIEILCGYPSRAHNTNTSSAWLQGPSPVADRAVQLGVGLLCRFLVLCSSRGNGLARRTAEPKWRQKLRDTTAVRTHKYQLLLSELPHADLSVTVQTLLNSGFVCEGGELGWRLLDSEMVDLRFYSLFTLGLLYQAVSALLKNTSAAQFADDCQPGTRTHISNERTEEKSTAEAKESHKKDYNAVLTQLRALYTRRQEVFGEELLCFRPTTASHATAHSLVRTDYDVFGCKATQDLSTVPLSGLSAARCHLLSEPTPVVVDVVWKLEGCGPTHDPRARHLAHCLQNRSMVTPEGKLVLDCRRHTFDGWVLKGTATTSS